MRWRILGKPVDDKDLPRVEQDTKSKGLACGPVVRIIIGQIYLAHHARRQCVVAATRKYVEFVFRDIFLLIFNACSFLKI